MSNILRCLHQITQLPDQFWNAFTRELVGGPDSWRDLICAAEPCSLGRRRRLVVRCGLASGIGKCFVAHEPQYFGLKAIQTRRLFYPAAPNHLPYWRLGI